MSSPSDPFRPFLDGQGFVLLDGGLATALEARGQDLNDPLWSARALLEAPDEVVAVHRAYLEAGADCIATVTYQATFEGFAARGLGEREAEEAFHRAVQLAVEARDAFWATVASGDGRMRPLVAASVGPYGAYLADGSEYTGDYDLDEDALVDWHRPRWRLLADSPVDVMGCETVPSLAEVRALLRLLDETPGRWAWISLQCRDEAHLADGTPVGVVARACRGASRLSALGVNCVPPERVAPLLQALRGAPSGVAESGAPVLVAYPNAGERYDATTKRWVPDSASMDPAAAAPEWFHAGARVLGGCCRTGPETIRAMRAALQGPGVPGAPPRRG